MAPDGITDEDWDRVHELAVEVVNLSATGDEEQSALATARLIGLLDLLQKRYGPLPSLLATRADYVESDSDREYWLLAAYEQAAARADLKNLVLVSESLASFYLSDRKDLTAGAPWVQALEEHLRDYPSEYEAEQLQQLRAEALALQAPAAEQ